MNSLDKRYLLAVLEEICGIGYDGECRDDNYRTECDHRYKNARWYGESLEFWQTRISEGDSKSDDDRRYEDKDDNRSSEDGKIRDNTGAVVEASKYFKKGRCIYCNSRTTTQNGEVICKECNRINNVLIGMVDVLMVASLGESAVSGVSLIDSINNLLFQMIFAVAAGGNVVISRFIGGRNR